MTFGYISKHKQTILYGVALAVLLFLLKWLEWRFIIVDHTIELYAGCIAVIFTGLGVWLALKLSKPKTTVITVEKELRVNDSTFVLNEAALDETGISKRELDVLLLMAEGLSNQEIAERLFVSLNTIKTHSSNVFAKLDVERRTQAVEKAKRLSIIP
ncbi:LuxR C-terminal-related transcriptional regulator [uncultured Mucilaginibacter sp.]|uniref:response regulator transcription factor n=1 Tax=uncultured Mucilaginibacter sp. TaxID=797541 RepID=UPI0025FD513A|nr:LuxR C-terminal-related transcriptional regulator [uncultured Mucilaginibacter sp.]